jgi:cell division initiation protein
MRKRKPGTDDMEEGATSASASSATKGGRLTPLDIQQVEFRRSFKGYDEREVDEFLDRLTEDFAAALDEAQRLRDRAEGGLGAVVAGGGDRRAAAERTAEEIVRKAREDAERIVREAEQRAASASPRASAGSASPGERAGIASFIAREREFLTSLATLVQGHAEAVKGMAADARSPGPRQGASPRDDSSGTVAGPPTGDAATEAASPSASPPASGAAASPGARPAPGPDPKASTGATSAGGARRATPSDSTPTPPGEGHVTIPDPRPAGVTKGDPKLAEGDPALRELFWGDHGEESR